MTSTWKHDQPIQALAALSKFDVSRSMSGHHGDSVINNDNNSNEITVLIQGILLCRQVCHVVM